MVEAGLQKTSTSSPSWNFETLHLVLFDVAGVLVYVPALLLGKETSGMSIRSLRTSRSCRGLGISTDSLPFMPVDTVINNELHDY